MYKRLHVSGIAPAKRGVPVLLHVFAVEIISIHAPVWGRASASVLAYHRKRFQFTPPCGGGRTSSRNGHMGVHNFNSRPRVGAGRA